MTTGRVIGFIVCMLLAFYTGNKLRKMFAIRGWVPDAHVDLKVVTGKAETVGRHGAAYWVAWDNMNPSAIGNHRVNLDQRQWAKLTVGDRIEVRFVDDDPAPYLRTGTYASAGNVGLDLVLLVAEIIGAVFCLLPLLKRNLVSQNT